MGKINANKYGENLNWFLNELSVSELAYLESGELEVVGGDNGECCTLPIPELAGVALAKIEQQQQETDELQAQVNMLRKALGWFHGDKFIYSEGSEYLEQVVIDALAKSREQCLASANADAIDKAISDIISRTGVTDDPSPELQAHLETCSDFMHYADKLREGAI